MRLSEHPDFDALINGAAAHYELPSVFVEKDYWITEVLRCVQAHSPSRLIFKGGTSLSKGWNLINRFSEDVDLFLDRDVDPRLSNTGVTREMRELRDAVGDIPGLVFVDPEGRPLTRKGIERIDTFEYDTSFPNDIAGIPPTIRLEVGIQSGKQPIESRTISSHIADFINGEEGLPDRVGRPGELRSFKMNLLASRRTFVEKLFTIHGKIDRYLDDGTEPGRDLRHYADLHALAQTNDVREMLKGGNYSGPHQPPSRHRRHRHPRVPVRQLQ